MGYNATVPLSGIVDTSFKYHIIKEIAGITALQTLKYIDLVASDGTIEAQFLFSSVNVSINPPNTLNVVFDYTPDTSFTLAQVVLITDQMYRYLTYDVYPKQINTGTTYRFTLTATLNPQILSVDGMLKKFTIDIISDASKLLPLVWYIVAYGRGSPQVGNVSLKPSLVKVYGSDGNTVIASSTNITATYDTTNISATLSTDQFPVTNLIDSSDYISHISFIDTISGKELITFTKNDFEYVDKNSRIQTVITLQF
jgi:hypothetical protein